MPPSTARSRSTNVGRLTLWDGHSQATAVALIIGMRAAAQRTTGFPHLDENPVVVGTFGRPMPTHAWLAVIGTSASGSKELILESHVTMTIIGDERYE